MDYKLREAILKPYMDGKPPDADIRYFVDMPLAILQTLMNHDYVEYAESPHSARDVRQLFVPFLRRNPSFNAHGYVISEKREDSRISIEGVSSHGHVFAVDEIIDFANTFHNADDFTVTAEYAYCWYD